MNTQTYDTVIAKMKIVERPSQRFYLEYTKDLSKNHPDGLKGRKIKPKVVVHNENLENSNKLF